jgi:hypothetical protein
MRAVHIHRAPAFRDCVLIFVQVQVCTAEAPVPKISEVISGTDAESQLNRGEGLPRPPRKNKCSSLTRGIAGSDFTSPTPPIVLGIGTSTWLCGCVRPRWPTPLQFSVYDTDVSIWFFVVPQKPTVPFHRKTSFPPERSKRIGLGYGRGYSSLPSASK